MVKETTIRVIRMESLGFEKNVLGYNVSTLWMIIHTKSVQGNVVYNLCDSENFYES